MPAVSAAISIALILCVLWNIYESRRLKAAYKRLMNTIDAEEKQRKRLADYSEKYIALTEELFKRSEQKTAVSAFRHDSGVEILDHSHSIPAYSEHPIKYGIYEGRTSCQD